MTLSEPQVPHLQNERGRPEGPFCDFLGNARKANVLVKS